MVNICSVIAAHGYVVGPPVTLDQLNAQADLVFKGTVMSSGKVADPSFKVVQGFASRETTFEVVSILKGGGADLTIRFRHYDEDTAQSARMFQPQYYHFEVGNSYLVFGRRSDGAHVRQLWFNHTMKPDQGALWCPDDKPLAKGDIKKVFWSELTGMLKSTNASAVLYSISQLDGMSISSRGFGALNDFARNDVLAAVSPLLRHTNNEVTQSAIVVIGSHNPYLKEDQAAMWLNTIGKGHIPGLAKLGPAAQANVGGSQYWEDLAAIGGEHEVPSIRATAIRALGLVCEPLLREHIERWLGDGETAVRASATLLVADYPELSHRLVALAEDRSPETRAAVAYAIGFGQRGELIAQLQTLLWDGEPRVRRAAAMSLLSHDPADGRVNEILQENVANKEFRPLFLNALASRSASPYLDNLAQAVSENWQPTNWWGGEIPALTSWKLLFKRLQKQPASALRSGDLDRYLDAIEKVDKYSSSEPRDIYALYVQRGLKTRATAFREKAIKAHSYDIDYFFKQVDEHPARYLTE